MRARFLNEIKQNREGSGLGAIGIGRLAMLFARDLERDYPAFRSLKTIDQLVSTSNYFFRDLKKEVLNALGVQPKFIKRVNLYALPGDIRGKVAQIFREDEVIKYKKIIPYPNYREKKIYDNQGNISIAVEEDGTYSDVEVEFNYNSDRGVLKVKYDLNENKQTDQHDAELVFCHLYMRLN